MQYTKEEIQAGVKFLQNANVNFDYDKDEMRVCLDIDVGCRIWTDGTSIWSRGVVKGVKVHNLSLVVQHSKESYAKEDWDDLTEDELYWSGGLTGYAFYDGTGKDGSAHKKAMVGLADSIGVKHKGFRTLGKPAVVGPSFFAYIPQGPRLLSAARRSFCLPVWWMI